MTRAPSPSRLRLQAVAGAVLVPALLLGPLQVPGWGASPPPAPGIHPRPRWQLELPLLALGAGAQALGDRMGIELRAVPAEGLDPSRIVLGMDRRAVGKAVPWAAGASDRTRDAALALPLALCVASAPPGHRLRAPLQRAVLLLEAEMITDGLVTIFKRGVSRPRPYAYLGESDRPDDGRYDVSSASAFESLPSGHTAVAWRAASFAISDHLLTRPDADWREHAAVGFVGGALAAGTAALRVEAGVHFPSDVIAGSALGIIGGAGVPWLHRYVVGRERAPLPRRAAWLGAVAGTAAGIGAALLIAPAIASD
jgi:membrane-associated phospholipid phosphatase